MKYTEQEEEMAVPQFKDGGKFFEVSGCGSLREYHNRPELLAVAKAARAYIAKKFDV